MPKRVESRKVERAVFWVWSIETQHPFAITADRHVWAFHPDRYELQEWSERGQITSLERDAPWFPPISVRTFDFKPYRYPTGLRVDGKGRVWTTTAIPLITDWGKPAELVRIGGEGFDTTTYNDKYYTRLEVIEPKSGRLLVSQKIPGISGGFGDGEFLLMMRSDENGIEFVDVYEVSLEGAPQ
jgi:hypothetical protein